MKLPKIRIACWLCRYRPVFGRALLFLLVCLPVVSIAETPATPMKFEYVFDIGGEPGFAIIQDRDGTLWIMQNNGTVDKVDPSAQKFTLYRHNPLEGLDRDLVQAGKQRSGRYSGLRGRTYTLRINGTNNDGVWNTPEQEVRLEVNVQSPPWLRWWAWMLYALTGGLLFFGIER